jgi:serine phosphatase RsbU (regulator of sigma subunit)
MKKALSIILFLICLISFSQTNELKQKIILGLIDSAKTYAWSSPGLSLKYSEKAELQSKEINFIEGIIFSLKVQTSAYYIQGFTDKALEKGLEAIRICEKNNFSKGLAPISNSIGLIYQDIGEYEKSIIYFDISIDYGKKNSKDIDTPLNNKANSYYYKKKYKKSIELHKQALKLREARNDSSGIADCKNDIGIVYIELKEFEIAYEYIIDCYKIKEAILDTEGIAFSSSDMANLYIEWNKPKEALKYIERAFEVSKLMNSPRYKEISYELFAKTYNLMGDDAKAYKYQLLFSNLRDSLRSNESIKQIAEMQTKYNTEKKTQSIKLKNIQIKNEKLENKKTTIQRNYTFLGLLLVLVLIIIVFRSNRQKKKANVLLSEQKNEIIEKNEELNQQNEEITAQRDQIEKQKEIVEEIHHEVEQSINYAKRLQESILPEEKLLAKHVLEHFVLFKPKDNVSGDFYWWTNIENHTVITAADCTGHGVPGAFMSMLGVSFLREIVMKEYITHTGVILRRLRKEIIKSLKQKGEMGGQKDGMDMALISINHETNIVQFSGANNPLYIVKSGKLKVENEAIILYELDDNYKFKLYEVKPDKMPIAIYEKMDNFITHEIQLEKGDQLYMFSDGYADQFGGPKGKKFKYKPFKQLLLENADKPMAEQKEILNNAFENWKGNLEQIDDVVVLGIKIYF